MNAESATPPSSLSLEDLQRLDARCLEFEQSWQRGETPRLEGFLDGQDGAEREWLVRELLRLDLEYRNRNGDRPALEEYQSRLPNDAQVVEAAFAARSADRSSATRVSSGPQPTDDPKSNAGTDVLEAAERSFGDYKLLELLGEGGMGVVYKARQKSADRVVAVKIIRPDRLSNDAVRKREVFERFRLEARAAARLDHPNIVPVYEVGQIDDRPFYSMQYVTGRSLRELLDDGPLAGREAAALMEPVARAVHYAHRQQIVHRDLKPRNILVEESNDDGVHASAADRPAHNLQPRVTDFGLARLMDDSPELTQSGEVLGTPAYMSPEQARGRPVDHTTDVYSLGATLYEALTGRPPFQAPTIVETQRLVIEDEPVSPRRFNPLVDADLETVCLKCLEKEPAGRYPSAGELADDLKRYLDGRPLLARPLGRMSRAWRWCRRRPRWAALWTLTAVLLLVLSVGGPLVAWRQMALRREADDALHQADVALASEREALSAEKRAWGQAQSARLQAERELRRAESLLYAGRIAAVRRAWEAGDDVAARETLATTDPRLRGWEYDFWRSHWTRRDRPFPRHQKGVRVVDFSRNGRWLLTANRNRTVRVWSVVRVRVLRSFKTSGVVYAAKFNPAGNRIAVACDNGAVELWGQKGRLPIWKGDAHRGRARGIGFSPDGERLLSTGDDGIARIWETTGGTVISELKVDGLAVRSAAFTSDGRTVIAAADALLEGSRNLAGIAVGGAQSRQGLVWWDAATGKQLRRFTRSVNQLADLKISPDGRSIALAIGHGVELCRADDGRPVRFWRLTVSADCIAWDRSSRRLAIACNDGIVRILESNRERPALALNGQSGPLLTVAFSPDGRSLATGSMRGAMRLWTVGSSRQARSFSVNGPITTVACSGDGRRIAAGTGLIAIGVAKRASGQQGLARLRVWDLSRPTTPFGFTRVNASVTGIAFRPHREEIAAAWSDNVVTLTGVADNGQNLKPTKLPVEFNGAIRCMAVSRDGKTLLSGDSNGVVRLCDLTTGRVIHRLPGQDAAIQAVVFSPDGRHAVSGNQKGKLVMFDVATGARTRAIAAHKGAITCLAATRNGRRLVTGGADRLVKLWDAKSGQLLRVFRGHAGPILGVDATPAAGRIASLAADSTVRLWDPATGFPTMTLPVATARTGGLAFSPDGRRLIAGTSAGRVHMWELEGTQSKRSDSAGSAPTIRGPSGSAN